MLFELSGSMRRGMLCEHPRPRPLSKREAGIFWKVAHVRERLVGRPRHQDLGIRVEELVEADPRIRNDRRSAGGGFKQSYARRMAGVDHGGARDVEREALRAVERRMLWWRQMLDPVHVR